MNFKSRRIFLAATAAVSLAGFANRVHAADQPIKLIVGYPAGGTTDVLARLVATMVGNKLGRSIIVENRPGASGNIAAQAVAKGPADGSTLLFVPSSHATNASLYKKLTFDTVSDFTAIGMVASTPYVLVVHPQIPAKTVAEFVALLKAEPGRYQYASASQGTGQHLAAELFKKTAGVDMTQIPFKGSSAAFPDLMSGRVPIMFDNVAVMRSHIRSGALRPLAVTSTKRSPLLPEVPTIAESFPGYEVQGWFAMVGPAKLPTNLMREINAALNSIASDPNFKRTLTDLGAEAITGTPAAADEYIRQEVNRWGGVIRAANITLD